MPGNRFFIKAILFGVLLIMSSAMNAQEPGKKNAWPDHLKLQHAGGIGYFSIGAGHLFQLQVAANTEAPYVCKAQR